MTTEFIMLNDVSKKKEIKKTVFTHYIDTEGPKSQKFRAVLQPSDFVSVIYIGKQASSASDTFIAIDCDGFALIYLGTKGDEFDQ